MNVSGVVLIVIGAWVLCQVLGGDALNRLGIVSNGTPLAGRDNGRLRDLPG